MFAVTVYLTLKLDFNIKQQQMVSSEGRKISLDIAYHAECARTPTGRMLKRGETTRAAQRIRIKKHREEFNQDRKPGCSPSDIFTLCCLRLKQPTEEGKVSIKITTALMKRTSHAKATCFKC